MKPAQNIWAQQQGHTRDEPTQADLAPLTLLADLGLRSQETADIQRR